MNDKELDGYIEQQITQEDYNQKLKYDMFLKYVQTQDFNYF